jgi:hypothetical protein
VRRRQLNPFPETYLCSTLHSSIVDAAFLRLFDKFIELRRAEIEVTSTRKLRDGLIRYYVGRYWQRQRGERRRRVVALALPVSLTLMVDGGAATSAGRRTAYWS